MNLRHIDLLCFLKNKRQVSNNQLLVPSLPLKLKKNEPLASLLTHPVIYPDNYPKKGWLHTNGLILLIAMARAILS